MAVEEFLNKLKKYLSDEMGLRDVLIEMPREQGFFNEQIIWSVNAETDYEPFEAYETTDGKIAAGFGPAVHVGDVIWDYLLDKEKYSDILDYKVLAKKRDEMLLLLQDRNNWSKYKDELSGVIEILEKGDEIAKKVSDQTGIEVKQILPTPPSKNTFFYASFDGKGLSDEVKIEKIGKAWIVLYTAFNEISKQEGEILEKWKIQIEEKRRKNVLPEDEALAKAVSELLRSWTSVWCSHEIPSGFPGFEGGSAKWIVRTRGEPYIMIFETEDAKVTVAYEAFRVHSSVSIDHRRSDDTDKIVMELANKENWPKYENTDLRDVIERYRLGEEVAKKAREITGFEVKFFIPRKHCHDAALYATFDSKGMGVEKKIEMIKNLVDLLGIAYGEFKKSDEEIKAKYGLKK
ncbi:MAG: hypothetical protein NZ873_01520 [Crenarchaeota archaeon]|nr:hypothetical protein [Thermoproteota archaeon]MDW8034122.1 hypothetical protein [Nitrososphaerota archaeon]